MAKPTKGAPKPRQKFTVRSLHEADPGYAGLIQKQAELRTARTRLDGEEGDLLFKLGSQKPQDRPINRRVAALLGEAEDHTNTAPDGLRARLPQVQAERRDVEEALRVVEDRVRQARIKASGAICAEVEPEFKARVAALACHFTTAFEAHQAVEEVIDALQMADVACTRAPFTEARALQIFGTRGNPEGRVERWFAAAVKAGLVDKAAVPAGLA